MKFLRLLLVPFAAIVVILARLGLPIRFGQIVSNRIGHMAGNMECYLCEREAGLSTGWDFWYHVGEPCSAQLDTMLRRVIRIDRTPFTRICAMLDELSGGKHGIDTLQVDRDIANLFERQPPHLYFTPEERERGDAELRAMGISAPWVCLIVRDGAYLPELPYHSYRDSDIATYEQAVWALIKRGYYVVRMGIKVAKPMPWHTDALWDSHVIDFATNGMHTDFRSMYLAANCAFAVSNGCGIDAVPVIFRRPICYVNYVPVEYLQTYHAGSMAIWKHHMKDGKRMTLQEIYASGAGHFMRAENFEDAKITLVDNMPQEIADVVAEFCEGPKYSPEDEAAQAAFWRAFPRSVDRYKGYPLHGEIRMRIGREFLKGYA